ncbi:MAG TPA: group II intron reverse transcriptase/maturase [Candidatus Acidoferrum sp.]|nr:group II intron reverse transcriptase/maturase [Candidatus Acidoferrum sp.]
MSKPIQLDLFPGRACVSEAKPATVRSKARVNPDRRDGVSSGGTQRKHIKLTGETLFGPAEATPTGREVHKGETRKRGNEAKQGVGGGRSTGEAREKRVEGRAATFIKRTKQGKAAGLPPKGKAQPRRQPAERKAPVRLNNARKLQRTLYRVAKQQPKRRFTLLYDKVCRRDILQEAWQRVKSNKGAAGVDQMDINAIREYGEERFLNEVEQELRSRRYRTALVRRVHIPKPGQPGKTRPLGIPTVKDRVVQMAVKLVIEPLFEADFLPCSFGFRPKRTPRMALSTIVQSINEGYSFVVDVDLRSYFDTISHDLLLRSVERRVGDIQILRLIRAWLKAGVMEEGRVAHPDRGSPQGGVISPLLSNIFLHEVDRQWCRGDGFALGNVRLVRYADDMVLLARTEQEAREAWTQLQAQFSALHLIVNQEKSRLTTLAEGFAFLGFEFRKAPGRMLYMWPREKACLNIRHRVREVVRSFPSNGRVDIVIQKLNPVLNGWCTYFRAGNSNRTFHKVDWAVRSELQLWLRRKHQCAWGSAKKRWGYHFLHGRCRLYRMVGKVSHLEGLRRMPPDEDDRRAGCGKSASPVR